MSDTDLLLKPTEPATVGAWWTRQRIDLQFMVMIIVLLATIFRNGTSWVVDLANGSASTAKAVTAMADEIQGLEVRMAALETANQHHEQDMAQIFPRRTELEPRLKAIEESQRDMSTAVRDLGIALRRYMENYRR